MDFEKERLLYEGGDEGANAAPADNEAAAADHKSSKSKHTDRSLTAAEKAMKAVAAGDAEMCCCCVCQCSTKETKEMSCCCILPVKCGVYCIGGLIIFITIAQFFEVFYQLLNDQIAWWYVAIGVALCIPLLIATSVVIVFYSKDTRDSRDRLSWACILVIISVSLSSAWNVIYFLFFYKQDSVVTGNDGVGYVKATRKQEVVFSLYIAAVVDAAFAYFICVIGSYKRGIGSYEERMGISKPEEKKE